MELKQVAVLGATGSQGGAVAEALDKKGVKVVAITRNPDSEKAKALAARPNTTVRKADLNDVDSMVAAFEGCDGAYVVANFWELMSAAKEMEQYKNATDALKKSGGMKHVIFSTLEETATRDFSKIFKTLEEHETGPMTVPHFDGKARAEAYFADLPTTLMNTSCYTENFATFFPPKKEDDGSYAFTLPLGEEKFGFSILKDIGVLTANAFGKEDLIGKRIGQTSFYATGDEAAEILSKATGKTVKYNSVPWETFAAFGFPGAEELAQMFEFWRRTNEEFRVTHDMNFQLQIMDGASFTEPVEYLKSIGFKLE